MLCSRGKGARTRKVVATIHGGAGLPVERRLCREDLGREARRRTGRFLIGNPSWLSFRAGSPSSRLVVSSFDDLDLRYFLQHICEQSLIQSEDKTRYSPSGSAGLGCESGATRGSRLGHLDLADFEKRPICVNGTLIRVGIESAKSEEVCAARSDGMRWTYLVRIPGIQASTWRYAVSVQKGVCMLSYVTGRSSIIRCRMVLTCHRVMDKGQAWWFKARGRWRGRNESC